MPNHRVIRIRLDPVLATRLSISTIIAASALFYTLARHQPNYVPFQGVDIFKFILGLPILILFHEAVHAIAWMLLGKLPLKAFKFGIFWQGFMPYCHCKEAMSVRVYSWGALMPLCITVPVFVGSLFVWPSLWLALLAALSLSGCWGDVLLFQKLRAMKQNDLVLDCPDEAGCDVLIPLET